MVFVDEVHERSQNIDLVLMGLAKRFADKGSACGTKVVVASATLDESVLAPFRALKLNVHIENVKVPSPFAVNVVKDFVGSHYLEAMVTVYSDRRQAADEQLLCFLPSQDSVRKAAESFKEITGTAAETLYAQMPVPQLEAAIARGTVFFSTNIAETSITFPNICHVIDFGKLNASGLNEDEISYLEEKFAPRSTCKQRKGRCGRTRPGYYYPLYATTDLTHDFAIPQVRNTEQACWLNRDRLWRRLLA